MALQSQWYFTGLPVDIIKILEKDLNKYFDPSMEESKLVDNQIDKHKRNSMNTWIPTEHWIGGWVWHYIMKSNKQNFLYDITNIEEESMQYTQYGEGEFYNWHIDSGISQMKKPDDFIRKISFSLQLSEPDEYEGGNLELIDENRKRYVAPRQRGSLILFDSRTQHRVCKVTKGVRKSLVGWVVGPRWK
tara:strand:+ start:709 stop:1275 length:567 start_codon:yes stop_codon:yes gene_type:complete